MVFALIFAGGRGTRTGLEVPKQFIDINGKPILVHTLEIFNNSKIIDEIVVVTLPNYISIVEQYVFKFNLSKVKATIAGGSTAMESQFNGLAYLKQYSKPGDIVYIHDGVRPFIDGKLLEKCKKAIEDKGNAITISPATETICVLSDTNNIGKILPRQECVLARAPQVFYLDDIFKAHLTTRNINQFVDSASLMMNSGIQLNVVEGPSENIKITTQYDLVLCKLWMEKKNGIN